MYSIIRFIFVGSLGFGDDSAPEWRKPSRPCAMGNAVSTWMRRRETGSPGGFPTGFLRNSYFFLWKTWRRIRGLRLTRSREWEKAANSLCTEPIHPKILSSHPAGIRESPHNQKSTGIRHARTGTGVGGSLPIPLPYPAPHDDSSSWASPLSGTTQSRDVRMNNQHHWWIGGRNVTIPPVSRCDMPVVDLSCQGGWAEGPVRPFSLPA